MPTPTDVRFYRTPAALGRWLAASHAKRGEVEVRRENRSGVYSYEQRDADRPAPYAATLRRNRAAGTWFEFQPPSYRKAAIWWIVSGKREETRLRRLEPLAGDSAASWRMARFRPAPPARKGRRPAAS